MDEESVDIQIASSSKESNLSRNKGIDYDTGIRHIIAPALIGLVLGIFFQEIILEKYGWPSPPQGAILVSILISPLLYIILVRDEFSRWYEYSMGLCVPGMIFFVMWFSKGAHYFVADTVHCCFGYGFQQIGEGMICHRLDMVSGICLPSILVPFQALCCHLVLDYEV